MATNYILYLSKPVKEKLVTHRGDTIKFTLVLKDGNGDVIDLTDYDFVLTVYKGNYSTTYFTVTSANAVDNLSTVFTKASQSWSEAVAAGIHDYKIIATNSDGTYTIMYGEFEVI